MTSTTRHHLIVAPYPGEFGWELMNWQGRVRHIARSSTYDQMTIVGSPDRRALYGDLLRAMPSRVRFCPCRPLDLPGEACDDHRIDAGGTRIDAGFLAKRLEKFSRDACRHAGMDGSGDVMLPTMDSALWPTTITHQTMVSLHRAGPIDIDIALIPRNRDIAPERNQPDAWWRTLEQRLTHCGLRVMRAQPPLNAAISTLSRARIAVGASTGGLHLASLCDCPHYVWGPGPEAVWTPVRMTNRQRYETIWNPLATPCLYDECGWQPSIEHVVRSTLSALRRIGRPSLAATRPKRASAKWLIRRKLSAWIMTPSSASKVPWRVREFVRSHLI